MRRAALLLTTVVAVLSLPAAAWAGGYATVNLDSTPTGIAPGEPWNVEMTILQHGVTPMTDLSPAVVVMLNGNSYKSFAGKPVDGKPGVYRATVVFPQAGTYSYEVDDGFTNAVPHTFPPVEISGAADTAASGGIPWWPFALAAALVAVLALTLRGRGRALPGASSSAAPRSAPAGAPDPNG